MAFATIVHAVSSRAARLALAAAAGLTILAAPVHARAGGDSLQALGSRDLRLATIGYRLARANADRCTRHDMLTGLVLHDLSQYDPDDRAAVARAFRLGDGIGILSVVPDSPAARAGLYRNDEILAIGSAGVRDPSVAWQGAGSYDRMEAILSLLDTTLRAGPTPLLVRRGNAIFVVRLRAEPGCGGRFNVSPSRSVNAWSDGHYVDVTTAIMDMTANDDELALIVAHEMSHNILDHSDKLANVPSGLFSAIGFGAGKVKATEIEADAYAVGVMARAGYDAEKSIPFLERAGRRRWWDVAADHPGIKRRIKTIRAALSEIRAAEAAGRYLPAEVSVPAETGAQVQTAAMTSR